MEEINGMVSPSYMYAFTVKNLLPKAEITCNNYVYPSMSMVF